MFDRGKPRANSICRLGLEFAPEGIADSEAEQTALETVLQDGVGNLHEQSPRSVTPGVLSELA